MRLILFICCLLLAINLSGFASDNAPLIYNPATQVFYKMSNDAQNIYLTVRADKPRIIQKILESGITFAINPKGRTGKTVSFTYPVIREPVKSALFAYISEPVKGSAMVIAKKLDSLAKEATKYLGMVDNQFKVAGLKLQDTLNRNRFRNKMPLFIEPGQYLRKINSYNIVVAASFNSERKYNYVLTIPLKLLKIRQGETVGYKIRSNGRVIQSMNYHGETLRQIPSPGYTLRDKRDPVTGKDVEVDADLNHPTEFLGSYTLTR